MNRFFKVMLAVLAVLAITLSPVAFAKTFERKPFAGSSGEPIKTIALVKVGEPWGYFLGEGGASLIRPKHREYEQAGFRFDTVAERLLTAHLKAAGFNVISVPVERKKPYYLLPNYKALSTANVDAYLDIATGMMGGVGYRKKFAASVFASKVGPYVRVFVQLVSARSKKVLYAEMIEYSWSKGHTPSGVDATEIDAPDDHIFENPDAVRASLKSGTTGLGMARLEHGMDVTMRRIVAGFSAYPAVGPSPQATPTSGIGAPTEVAKAAPASTPSPSAATTGWTQIPIPDFRTIAGKWEGSGRTVEGKEFSLEITYREDGSYTFRANRGTRNSSRVRLENGVLEGTSWTTGERVTVVLYEDEKGNRVLKGRRVDGLNWAVAMTRGALSKFLADEKLR